MKKFTISAFLLCLSIFVLSFTGCGSNIQTVIKDHDIKVKVPEVKADIEGSVKNADSDVKTKIEQFFSTLPDSVYVMAKADIIDTIGQVAHAEIKMFPNMYKNPETGKPQPVFAIKVKPPDQHFRYSDTTNIPLTPKKTIKDKAGNAIATGIIIISIAICVVVGFFFIKKGQK